MIPGTIKTHAIEITVCPQDYGAYFAAKFKKEIRGLTKERNAILGSIEAHRNGERRLFDGDSD